MPNYTKNYNLKKPLQDEFYNIDDHNGNMDIIDAELKNRATLGSDGKVPSAQLPQMDYIPNSQKGAAGGVATLGSDGKISANQMPVSGSYIPTSEKGAAGGVASLGSDGKVPSGQLPQMDYVPNSKVGTAGGVASLGSDGKVPTGQLPAMDYVPNSQKGSANGVATLGSDGKVPAGQLPEISVSDEAKVVLYTYGWNEGADGRFYQTVSVPIVKADTKVVMVDVDLTTDDVDAKIEYLDAWALPSANEVDQGDGTLTFYAYEYPTVNIPVNVGVM